MFWTGRPMFRTGGPHVPDTPQVPDRGPMFRTGGAIMLKIIVSAHSCSGFDRGPMFWTGPVCSGQGPYVPDRAPPYFRTGALCCGQTPQFRTLSDCEGPHSTPLLAQSPMCSPSTTTSALDHPKPHPQDPPPYPTPTTPRHTPQQRPWGGKMRAPTARRLPPVASIFPPHPRCGGESWRA